MSQINYVHAGRARAARRSRARARIIAAGLSPSSLPWVLVCGGALVKGAYRVMYLIGVMH